MLAGEIRCLLISAEQEHIQHSAITVIKAAAVVLPIATTTAIARASAQNCKNGKAPATAAIITVIRGHFVVDVVFVVAKAVV